jgi:A1 cistron-splicing factor AAR2
MMEDDTICREKTGTLLLLNSPEEMEFGIDNQCWKIGKKFKGVKLIPEGAHYVHYSLKDEEYANKISFFIYIKPLTV